MTKRVLCTGFLSVGTVSALSSQRENLVHWVGVSDSPATYDRSINEIGEATQEETSRPAIHQSTIERGCGAIQNLTRSNPLRWRGNVAQNCSPRHINPPCYVVTSTPSRSG